VQPGTVELKVGDAEEQIEATEPVAYEASSKGISETEYTEDCP